MLSPLRATLYLVVIAGVSEVRSVPPETCRQSYDRCFQSSFADTVALYHIMDAWSLTDILPSWNATILPQLCRDYEQFSNCMPLTRCSISDKLLLEGIDDAWTFLCNDTSPDAAYYNYSACYRQSSAIQGTKYCNNTFSTKSSRLGSLSVQSNVNLACKYYDDYVVCLWTSTNSVCGSLAADWHQTYTINLLTPYVSQRLECSDWGSNGNTDADEDDSSIGGILVTTFVALSLLLMLFIVVVLAVVVARRRAKNLSSARSPTGSNVAQDSSDAAPPNYSEPYVIFERTSPEVATISGTSDSNHQETSDGSSGGPQYRIRLVDPLTGRQMDRGVVNNNEFPLKSWPTVMMVPPPYNDQPPPSFSSQVGSDDADDRGTAAGVAESSNGAAAADNYGFCPDEEDKQKHPEN